MNKYLYKIKDLEIPPWIKYWFLRKSKINFDLSEILNGTSFDLTNTVNKKLHLIDIFGNSIQNGEPTPENPIEVKSSGDNGYITEKIVNANLIDFSKFNLNRDTVFTFENDTMTISSESGYYNGVNMDITKLVKSNKGKILSFGYDNIVEVGSVVKSFQLVTINQQNITSYYAFQSYNYKYNIPNDISNIKKVTFQIFQNNRAQSNAGTLIIEKPILYFGEVKPTYVEHKEQTYTIPCQQPMRAIGNVKDTFVKENGVWYERHNIARILSYNGEEITTSYMSTTGELSTGAIVDYVLTTPTDLICTVAQITALEELQKAKTYNGVTHIYTDDEVPADLEIQYYKEKGE